MSYQLNNDGDRLRLTDDDIRRSAIYGHSNTGSCRGDSDEGERRRTITVPPGLNATQRETSLTRNDFVRRGVIHDEVAQSPPPLEAPKVVLAEGVSLTLSLTQNVQCTL